MKLSRLLPTCTGESDGALNIATVLPETGNLAFLGRPSSPVPTGNRRDQRCRRCPGRRRMSTRATPATPRPTSPTRPSTVSSLPARTSSIGAASSMSFTFIDKLVENCKIQFSPANTSPDFTDYEEDDLYFRTAPSDVLQGRVLADLMIEEGITTATFMALKIQDPDQR